MSGPSLKILYFREYLYRSRNMGIGMDKGLKRPGSRLLPIRRSVAVT